MNTADIQAKLIAKLAIPTSRLDRSLYKLKNAKLILFRTSKAHAEGSRFLYWFGFHRNRLENQDLDNLFILFVCGTEAQTIVMPASRMREALTDVATASDDNWKIKIYESNNRFELALTGRESEDITALLNRFDLLGTELNLSKVSQTPTVESSPEISIQDEIMSLDAVAGNSLHDKLIDMLRQIGEWMGYKSEQEYVIRPDVPYRLDVTWILNDAIHIAMEVQIGGNVTEAKDRLILARRFGARKLVIVTTPENVDRIKSVFRYETDVKHWLEIWGLESVYSMFVDGRSFFETFSQFNKHQYRDDVTEIV